MAFYILPAFVCLCMFEVFAGICAQEACVSSLRPTGNLREVVIGRCTLYQGSVNPVQFCKESTFDPRNCTEVWEAFSSAFLYRPRCNVSEERYGDYIQITDHPVPRDKALFWENVYPFVHRFSNHGAKYFTLSDTLTGYIGNGLQRCGDQGAGMFESTAEWPELKPSPDCYIGNGLQWCGDQDAGMSESPTECPEWEPTPDCPQSAQRTFWIAASRSFGRRASGHVHIMMNASSEPIFASSSYFAMYELPFLQANVTKATVLLVSEKSEPKRDACRDASLKELANIFESRGIEYGCEENTRDVAQLLCHDNPDSSVCSVLEQEPCGTSARSASSIIILALFFVPSALVL